jgi:hypothetical protein
VIACASGGASARVEHEGYAALILEPEPIGQLARNALASKRARLVDRAPAVHRRSLDRLLRKIEERAVELRQRKRAELETTVGDEVVRAKEEVGIAGESSVLLRAIATMAPRIDDVIFDFSDR